MGETDKEMNKLLNKQVNVQKEYLKINIPGFTQTAILDHQNFVDAQKFLDSLEGRWVVTTKWAMFRNSSQAAIKATA